ncbi:sensor domain-containing diguanylate cyclase [Streptacidiphilus jiangxiensis]|uniref:PAS domain S-box-containing protein/diguanylate cyclase (GGDEF) domain-containing protein n=1 Tax=Streptacidiphilus jiangxiensis TaxID=235985 RepID=A0A1H7F710_STRJI|nr:sensor domain-containing diguanylate cyclase [Streptacidiphilus jiangxiensis]SEK19760.1 PAS domain S-box-containing protein/diguanylate cyclase (GGDEF) domain-containing protein [Streptacidiphilus jiangxiensis]
MDTEPEPYVRLATLRTLHRVIADLNAARSLAGTLQAVVEGAVTGLGFDTAVVNMVRPDGDLVVAAVWEVGVEGESDEGINSLLGQIGSRESWTRLLNAGDSWGSLVFLPQERGWARPVDIPLWGGGGARFVPEGSWHPDDMLLAPMYSFGGELLGVLSVDRPRNGRRPGPWTREALEMFSQQAGIAIGNARLRAEMQRALIRLEREQQALGASEESYRQAFEYAPSGMAITELHGESRGRLTRVNDALCRLLGRSRSSLHRYSFAELVHPEDAGRLRGIATENGRAEVRLARRDGGWLWVNLRNSVISDAVEGAMYLLTHVEDIEDRKRHELQLAHRASHDALTGLPNAAELKARLRMRLCEHPGSLPAVAHRPGGLGAFGGFEGYDLYEGAEQGWQEGRHGDHGGFADHGGLAGALAGGQGADAGRGHAYGHPAVADGPGFEHVHAVPPDEAGAPPGGRALAVLFCDLNGFKNINDRHGHAAGDATLIEVARRLQHAVREGDTVARMGGDEFVVLADGVDRARAKDLADRLRTAIAPPIRWENRTLRVGVSIGIGWAGCGMSIDEVLHTADELMYVEKRARAGGGRSHRRAG